MKRADLLLWGFLLTAAIGYEVVTHVFVSAPVKYMQACAESCGAQGVKSFRMIGQGCA